MLIVSWLVRILAIVAAAFSIAIYFQVEGKLEQRAEKITKLESNLENAKKEKEEQATRATRAEATEGNLRSEVDELKRQVSEATSKTRNYTNQISELENRVRNLNASNTEQTEEIAKLKTDLLQRGSDGGLGDEYRKLYDESLKTVDSLRENIVTLERERDEARSAAEESRRQVAALTGAVNAEDVGSLVGEVLKVDSENNLVVINLGKLQSLSKDQQLIAFKPDGKSSFTLELETVNADYSIAKVVGKTGSGKSFPQVGDSVTNLF